MLTVNERLLLVVVDLDSAINDFYKRTLTPQYVSDLFLFPNANSITSDNELIRKIDTIQNQSVEAFIFSFSKIAEYRHFFNRLYNKNKHGNAVLFGMGLAHAPPDIDPEDLELVFVLDSEENPFDDLGACIVGQNTVQRSATLLSRTQDMLVTLIHRYKDYLRYQGNYPPLFVFGESPLAKDDWIQYRDQIKNLLPSPLKIPSDMGKCDLSVEELYKWLHSTDWSSTGKHFSVQIGVGIDTGKSFELRVIVTNKSFPRGQPRRSLPDAITSSSVTVIRA